MRDWKYEYFNSWFGFLKKRRWFKVIGGGNIMGESMPLRNALEAVDERVL